MRGTQNVRLHGRCLVKSKGKRKENKAQFVTDREGGWAHYSYHPVCNLPNRKSYRSSDHLKACTRVCFFQCSPARIYCFQGLHWAPVPGRVLYTTSSIVQDSGGISAPRSACSVGGFASFAAPGDGVWSKYVAASFRGSGGDGEMLV